MGETANKVISIFTQSAADAVFDEIQISESEKMDKAIKTVKDALDKAHTGIKTQIAVKPLYNILSNYERKEAIKQIDIFVRKYEKFINAISPVTGRTVIYAQDPYADKSDDNIKIDIKFTIFIVYFATITEESTQKLITNVLKKIFGSFNYNSNN